MEFKTKRYQRCMTMNHKKQEMIMRELEWGINSDTNSIFLAGDIASETLHSIVIHLDTLLRLNPE